jgi:hypothetical protein
MTKPIDPKLRQIILADALPYELNMLEQTFLHLQTAEPGWLSNALIESFCLHARQLIDFFQNKQSVKAEQFTANGIYGAREASAIPKSLKIKLNTQIAHLTEKRTDVAAEKIGGRERDLLLRCLVSETHRFAAELTADDRQKLLSKYRSLLIVPGPPKATS